MTGERISRREANRRLLRFGALAGISPAALIACSRTDGEGLERPAPTSTATTPAARSPLESADVAVAPPVESGIAPITQLPNGGTMRRVPIGNGGHIVGGTMAADGTLGCRGDVGGAAVYDEDLNEFITVLPTNLDVSLFDDVENVDLGVYDFQVCWTNSDEWLAVMPTDMTMLAGHRTPQSTDGNAAVVRSSDRGRTWRVVYSGLAANGNNGGPRTWQGHAGVAADDPGTYLVSSETQVLCTVDDGATWHEPEGLPTPANALGEGGLGNSGQPPSYSCIHNDPADPDLWSASTGGRTFVSTTGVSGPFREVSAGAVADGVTFPNGRWYQPGVFIGHGHDGGLYRYTVATGQWEYIPTKTPADASLCVSNDPANPARWVLGTFRSLTRQRSGDDFATFDGDPGSINAEPTAARSARGIGWHNSEAGDWGSGMFAITSWVHPGTRNIWTFGGNTSPHEIQGPDGRDGFDTAFDAALPLGSGDQRGHVVTTVAHSALEQICVHTIGFSNDRLFVGAADEGGFVDLPLDVPAWPRHEQVLKSTRGPFSNALGAGFDVVGDRVYYVPSWRGSDFSIAGFSDDRGYTWTDWQPNFLLKADHYAPFTRVNACPWDPDWVIVSPGNSRANLRWQRPFQTRNAGLGPHASWDYIDPDGDPDWDVDYYNGQPWTDRRTVTFAGPDTAYLLVNMVDQDRAGIYETLDKGWTWQRASPLPIRQQSVLWFFNATLKRSSDGTLWANVGGQGNPAEPGEPSTAYRRSTGTDWVTVSELTEATGIAFTEPLDGYTDPFFAARGYVGGEYGMWACPNIYSDSADRQWVNLWGAPSHPHNFMDFLRTMEGDPSTPGRFITADACSGLWDYHAAEAFAAE